MTTGASEAALAALSRHLGLPLAFDDDSCDVLVGDQPFTIRSDGSQERLVVSALVADDLPESPSRKLVCDLLDLGFGMMHEGLPAVARDPETGFIATFAFFPLATLKATEFPDAFDKFVAFATALADRLDRERAGGGAAAESEPPDAESAFSLASGGFMQV